MITIDRYSQAHHKKESSSAEGHCAQGGQDTCHRDPEFSVVGPPYAVATCEVHLAGAVREALALVKRP